MRVISLQSGSNGNSIYVECSGVRLLFDAGISGQQAQQRLAAHGREITAVDALVISHDHRDHTHCMGVFQRKFGLPIWVTERTFEFARAKSALGKLTDVQTFRAGSTLEFGSVRVETIPTPHDGADGVAFVISDGGQRFGVLTDLGHPFPGLADLIGTLDAVLIESNFDPDLLAGGCYPDFLKQRIRGPQGHLSNVECAELLRRACRGGRLQWACLAHLSAENNTPNLALEAHRRLLGAQFALHVASRYEASGVLEV